MQDTTIAVDVAKSVFEVAVSHSPGKVSQRHRLSRRRLRHFLARQAPATVVMEACGSSHYWAREAQARGHQVRLLPAQDVVPYVRGNKTDRSDTKGILEADRNEDARPVPVKTVEQQALVALHRMRSRWVATRTSRLNTLRGLLRELGIVIPVGARQVLPQVWAEISDADSAVPASLRPVLSEAAREITDLERRIAEVERQLEGIARHSDVVRHYHGPGERPNTRPKIRLQSAPNRHQKPEGSALKAEQPLEQDHKQRFSLTGGVQICLVGRRSVVAARERSARTATGCAKTSMA